MSTFSKKMVLVSFEFVSIMCAVCMCATLFAGYKCFEYKKSVNKLEEQVAELETKMSAQNDEINELNNKIEYINEDFEAFKESCMEDEVEATSVEIVEPVLTSLGEFKLTAYCSCQKCCGKWALNRPKDENGNEIVIGSSGEVLIPKVSIAVDTSVIPHGSEVVINGNTYIAHDTGGAIKGNRIDVYHDNHQEAREFAVQYAEVFLVSN